MSLTKVSKDIIFRPGTISACHRLLTVSNHVVHQNKKRLCIASSRFASTAADVRLSSDFVQMDEKVEISVHNLRKGQQVTLSTTVTDVGKNFRACGHYVADDDGKISTFQQPSLGGTYSGVEPMGLFWSLDMKPGEKKQTLLKQDVTTPFDFTVAVQDGFVDFENLPWSGDNSGVLAQTQLYRHHMADGVTRVPIEENGIFGTLFVPKGKGPFPAVIDIYGMSGGVKEQRAALMASHGFATFALAYLNYKDLPKIDINISSIDLHYFLKAFDLLAAHPSVDREAMGCMASCVGGGYALFLTSMRPEVKCVASFNNLGRPGGINQTVEGEDIILARMRPERIVPLKGGRVLFKHVFRLEDNVPVPPAWRHGAKFLFINGLDDQCVHPDMSGNIRESFPPEYRDNTSFHSYPGTGHLIEPPYQPLCPVSYNEVFKANLVWGGEPQPHSVAQEDGWRRVIEFFKQNLFTDKASVSQSN